MRLLAALLGLMAFVAGRAQEAGGADSGGGGPGEAVAPTLAVIPGESGLLLLREGGTLKGRLVSTGTDGDEVEYDDGSVVRLRAGSVVGTAAGTGKGPAGARIEVERRDGRVVRGRFVSRDAQTVTVDVEGAPTSTPISEIRAVRAAPGIGPAPSWLALPGASPARIRTLQAPTAFRLESWEGVLSVTGIAEPTVTLGLLRFATLSAGTAFPSLYGQQGGELWFASLDAGLQPIRLVHLSAGVKAEFQRSGTQAWLYGALTVGAPSAYFSLYAGPPPVGAATGGEFGKTALSLAAGVEVVTNVWLLGEGWFGRGTEDQLSTQYGGGIRVGFSVLFVEIGLVKRPSGDFPVWASIGAGGRPAGGQQP